MIRIRRLLRRLFRRLKPSIGLMQIAPPTFTPYRPSNRAADPFDPVANIAASHAYIKARYGDGSPPTDR